jgi:nucleoside 2-deoxyribosyltransferase
MMKKLYLASPLGFSEGGQFFMYEKMIPALEKAGFKIINPWKLADEKKIFEINQMDYGMEKKKAWEKMNTEIARKNTEAIEECQGMIAVLDGPDVDSGTAAEIGYAAALGKPVVGYRGDFRLAGDNEGAMINLQVEYFIRKNGGKIAASLQELIYALETVFG